MVESIGLEVVDKDHIESTNLIVEEIDKTTESNIFEDFVTIPLALVGQSVGKLEIGFEVKKDLVGFISTLDPLYIYFLGKPPNSMIVDMDGFKTKGTWQRQRWIAWTLLAFRWAITLVPLWIWDELWRDFSVGVYHSHKTNRGSFLFICFPHVSTKLEDEFFLRRGA